MLLAACAAEPAREAEPAPATPGSPVGADAAVGFAGDSASLPASRGALGNPNGSDPKAAEAGGLLFAAMNCDGCHGAGATGFAAPSLSDGRWRYGGSDAELFQTISAGRPNGMPAFGKLLAPEIIWQLVSYLRSLPPPKNLPTTTW